MGAVGVDIDTPATPAVRRSRSGVGPGALMPAGAGFRVGSGGFGVTLGLGLIPGLSLIHI